MTRPLKIYVASSWKNEFQPRVVETLQELGLIVYDFHMPSMDLHRWPERGFGGFPKDGEGWKHQGPTARPWHPEVYREVLMKEQTVKCYKANLAALATCDLCMLVLPCGVSSHWELGYATASGKRCSVMCTEMVAEPELVHCEAVTLIVKDEIEPYIRFVQKELEGVRVGHGQDSDP